MLEATALGHEVDKTACDLDDNSMDPVHSEAFPSTALGHDECKESKAHGHVGEDSQSGEGV